MEQDAASATYARQPKIYETDVLKMLVFSFLISIMLIPVMVEAPVHNVKTIVPTALEHKVATTANLRMVQLTDLSEHLATGNVSSYRGFAYSDDISDVLRFVDPINQVTLN